MSGNQSTLLGAGRGAPRPTGALDGTSALRLVNGVSNFPLDYAAVKLVASGAVTANTLKTILSLSGSGVISVLGVESSSATSRTHRLKVTLDGTVIFDATTGAVANVTAAYMAIGSVNNLIASQGSVVTHEPMAFSTSLLIEYAGSLTETDGAYIGYRYYPT